MIGGLKSLRALIEREVKTNSSFLLTVEGGKNRDAVVPTFPKPRLSRKKEHKGRNSTVRDRSCFPRDHEKRGP